MVSEEVADHLFFPVATQCPIGSMGIITEDHILGIGVSGTRSADGGKLRRGVICPNQEMYDEILVFLQTRLATHMEHEQKLDVIFKASRE
jgi:hypothetical protein